MASLARTSFSLALAVGLALGFAGCRSSGTKDDGAAAGNGDGARGNGTKISVIYNNDNFGYLEPCGCRVDPIGGMYRRWHATQAIPAGNRVSVDAGNLFFTGPQVPSAAIARIWREQALAVVDAYNALGWDAFQPGENDFALGLAELRTLEKRAQFKFVSANLLEKATGKPAFAPHVLLERSGVKIGIFGLYGQNFSLPAELEARPPLEAAAAQAEDLRRRGAQLVIALSHQGLDADEALAKAVGGIDLIVGASTQSFLQDPRREGKTAIVQLSAKGQLFGEAVYQVGAKGAELVSGTVTDLDARFDIGPGKEANPMKALIARMNIAVAEQNRAASEAVWKEQEARTPAFATHLACTSCHGEQAKFQAKQSHAVAFLTLVARHKERSLDCLKCHSVGMGADGGFRSVDDAIRRGNGEVIPYMEVLKRARLDKLPADISYRKDPKRITADAAKWEGALVKLRAKHSFVNVQCENCHGQRPGHPFTNLDPSLKKVKAISCMRCHTADQTPAWYDKGGKPLEAVVNAAIKKVACPGM